MYEVIRDAVSLYVFAGLIAAAVVEGVMHQCNPDLSWRERTADTWWILRWAPVWPAGLVRGWRSYRQLKREGKW